MFRYLLHKINVFVFARSSGYVILPSSRQPGEVRFSLQSLHNWGVRVGITGEKTISELKRPKKK